MTDHQKLTDFIMKRWAKWKKLDLPPAYWLEPEFQSEYVRQIQKASSLLKVYPYDVIIEALSTDKTRWISSLFVKDIIINCQKIMKLRKIKKVTEDIKIETQEEKPYIPKKIENNKKGKLGGIDI